jgi:hypothetical protein
LLLLSSDFHRGEQSREEKKKMKNNKEEERATHHRISLFMFLRDVYNPQIHEKMCFFLF